MKGDEGFLTTGARMGYWIALAVAGLFFAVHVLGRIAFAMGGAA